MATTTTKLIMKKRLIALLMVMLLSAMSMLVSPVPALAQTATDAQCNPTPLANAFDFIRIGDVDGFGFGVGKGYVGSDGKAINVDNKGILTTGDVLPDLNGDGKISNRGEGDPFDNRSNKELAGTYLQGHNYIDNGSAGSDYTDLSLGKSFGYKTSPTYGRPFPDGDPKTLPNQPGFKFRFLVEKDKLPEGTPLFFNIMLGDYDVEPGQINLRAVSGNTLTIPLTASEKVTGGRNGIVEPAYVPLKFNQVFKDGDRKGKQPGYWIGAVDVDLDAPDEPYTAFDYAEIGTQQIPLAPCPPKEYKGEIRGLKWDDSDGDGERSTLISGNPPYAMFVIDLSSSTEKPFQGSNMGDVNGDGKVNSVLDGELKAFITLNQQLIDQGFGDTGKVSIIGFGYKAGNVDMDPVTPGIQLATSPGADKNNNGIPDVEDLLSSFKMDYGRYVANTATNSFEIGAYYYTRTRGTGTNYEPDLQLAISTLQALNAPTGKGNVVFISDGVPGGGLEGTAAFNTFQTNYVDEANTLQNTKVNVTAFGAGSGAQIPPLAKIDPRAEVFTTTDELIAVFNGTQGTTTTTGTGGLEAVLPGVTIYLDLNNNGTLDSKEPSQKTNDQGLYQFTDLAPGTYVVREVVDSGYKQTAPSGGFAKVTLGEDEIVSDINFGNTSN